MGNIILGFPNRIDSAVLSDGAWVESLSLDNLKDRAFARVARTIDTEESSSTFVANFGRRRIIRVFALIAHNLSLGARYRLEASNAADFSTRVHDNIYDVWGRLAGGNWDINAVTWGNNNFWRGGYTQEDIAGQTPVSTLVLPEDVNAQYWRVTLLDRANTAGFIQLGRVFFGEVFLQPKINMSNGAKIGYQTDTTIEKSLSGAEFFDEREPVRSLSFTLASLEESEAYARALELTRRAGISKEIIIIFDPDDVEFAAQRNFVGRLEQLSPLENLAVLASGGQTHSMQFQIKELR